MLPPPLDRRGPLVHKGSMFLSLAKHTSPYQAQCLDGISVFGGSPSEAPYGLENAGGGPGG